MEPSPRKVISRNASSKNTSIKGPDRLSNPVQQTQQPKELEKENPRSKHLPNALLLLKSFMRTRLQSNFQIAMSKIKNFSSYLKSSQREGCYRLKRILARKIYKTKMNTFAIVFICEARKAFIRKQQLQTRNKGLLLRLWKAVNQMIIRKQTQKRNQACEELINIFKTQKTKNNLKSMALKSFNSLLRNKLNSAFQTLKLNPANQSKKVKLYFSSISRTMNNKIQANKTFAFEIFKRLPKRNQEVEMLRNQPSLNEREKQLQQQLQQLIRQNKQSEETFNKQLQQHQKRKQAYSSELQQLKRRNSELQIEMAQLQQKHKNRSMQMSQLKIYENIYNNFLNFVHNSPEEMDKQQLIESLLVPMSEWNVPTDVIKMQNQCLEDLLKQYSKLKLKIPESMQVDNQTKVNKRTYEYLIKENSDLYATLGVLIENSRQQRNEAEFNELITSFVDIEDKFANIYQKIARKN